LTEENPSLAASCSLITVLTEISWILFLFFIFDKYLSYKDESESNIEANKTISLIWNILKSVKLQLSVYHTEATA